MRLEVGRFQVQVPANGILQSGIDQIQSYVQQVTGHNLPDDWRWEWKVGGKGEYVGALPKRIQKYFYQTHNIKLDSAAVSQVGNIASTATDKEPTLYYCDITNRIDWEPGAFGDYDSCYWGCRGRALDMLRENSGFAFRVFEDSTYRNGKARAWLAPHKTSAVMFNGYGLDLLVLVRILSIHFGYAYYKRVRLTNNHVADGTLWINGGTGWMLGEMEVVKATSHINLEWRDLGMSHECEHCGDECDEDDGEYYHGAWWCSYCLENNTVICDHCGEREYDDETVRVDGSQWCEHCATEYAFECAHCFERFSVRNRHQTIPDDWDHELAGQTVCNSCFKDISATINTEV